MNMRLVVSIVGLASLVMSGAFDISWATNDLTVTAVIQGVTASKTCASATTCDLDLTPNNPTVYGNVKIWDAGGGGAMISASDKETSGDPDVLTLKNVKITPADGYSSVDGDIYFYATFDSPPTTSGGGSVKYTRQAVGGMKRGSLAALNDWFKIDAWIDGDEINVWETKTVACSPLACGNFNLSKYEYWFTLADPRELKGEFWFRFNYSNDEITAQSGGANGLTVTITGDTGAIGTTDDDLRDMGLEEGSPNKKCAKGSSTPKCKVKP